MTENTLPDYLDINRAAYDSLADEYRDRIVEDIEKDATLLSPLFMLAEHITLATGRRRYLDVGCGNGLNLRMFADRGFVTVGVDISARMLEVASSTSPSSVLLHCDILNAPLLAHSFEVVMAKASIHNLPKDVAFRAMRFIRHLLVPGGVFYIATTASESSKEGLFVKSDYHSIQPRFRKMWTPVELEESIVAAGFDIERSFFNSEDVREKQWFNIYARPNLQ